jgi:hypothetical protein
MGRKLNLLRILSSVEKAHNVQSDNVNTASSVFLERLPTKVKAE